MLVEYVELSIQILPTEAGAEVACHHSIGVQHGYDLEDEIGTELQAYGVIAG